MAIVTNKSIITQICSKKYDQKQFIYKRQQFAATTLFMTLSQVRIKRF